MIEKIMYFLWCHELGHNPKSCKSHALYRDYLQKGRTHCGDCTQQSISCIRCHIQDLEKWAQNIVDVWKDKKGYCGEYCHDFITCPYEKEGKSEKERNCNEH